MTSPREAPSVTDAPVRGEPLAVELMNTRWADRDGIHDALATAPAATAWLDAIRDRLPVVRSPRGSVRRSLSAPEAADLRQLRDAIRAVAAVVTTDPRAVADDDRATTPITTALATINAAVDALPPRLLHREHGDVVADRRAPAVAGAWMAAIATDAVPLLAGDHDDGSLRACLAPGCVLYFVQDHPRREWCSPACGNRARVARHYEKTRTATRGPSGR